MEKEKERMENERNQAQPPMSRAERRRAAAEAEKAAAEAEKLRQRRERQKALDKLNPGKRLAEQRDAAREARAEEKARAENEARMEKLRLDSEREARKTRKDAASAREKAEKKAEKKPEKKAEKKPAAKAEPAAAPAEAKKPARQKTSGRPRVGLMVAMAAAIVLLLGTCIAALVAGHRIARNETSFSNVCVGSVAVGGKSRGEVLQALLDSGWDEEKGGTLTVLLPADIRFTLDYFEAGVSYTAEQMADYAMAYGHDGGDIAALLAYLDGLSHNAVDVSLRDAQLNEDYIRAQIEAGAADFEEHTSLSDYQLDREKSVMRILKGGGQMFIDRSALLEQVKEALLRHESELSCSFSKTAVTTPDFAALCEELSIEPRDAYYDGETGEIVPEIEGFRFDPEQAKKLWEQAETASYVEIPVEFLEPAMTAKELEELLFRDLLGECTTLYGGSSKGRVTNISLVAEKLDGLILLPGQEFSYNETVGQRTEEAGFQYAAAYDNGKVVQEIGGGICQVSSTLYNAVLSSDLQVTARTCHYFAVTYLPRGLDATVSWPGPDFKFVNNRDFPIRINAYSNPEKSAITLSIWGTNLDGSYVVPVAGSWAMYDETYPEVQIGWQAVSFREHYDKDGNLIEKVQEEYSTYYLHDEDIKWPEPTPTPTPNDGGGTSTPSPAPAPEPEPEPEPDDTSGDDTDDGSGEVIVTG